MKCLENGILKGRAAVLVSVTIVSGVFHQDLTASASSGLSDNYDKNEGYNALFQSSSSQSDRSSFSYYEDEVDNKLTASHLLPPEEPPHNDEDESNSIVPEYTKIIPAERMFAPYILNRFKLAQDLICTAKTNTETESAISKLLGKASFKLLNRFKLTQDLIDIAKTRAGIESTVSELKFGKTGALIYPIMENIMRNPKWSLDEADFLDLCIKRIIRHLPPSNDETSCPLSQLRSYLSDRLSFGYKEDKEHKHAAPGYTKRSPDEQQLTMYVLSRFKLARDLINLAETNTWVKSAINESACDKTGASIYSTMENILHKPKWSPHQADVLDLCIKRVIELINLGIPALSDWHKRARYTLDWSIEDVIIPPLDFYPATTKKKLSDQCYP